MNNKELTLGVLSGLPVAKVDGKLFMHYSYGRIVEELASRFKRVVLSVSELPEKTNRQDYQLPENVTLQPLPIIHRAIDGIKKSKQIAETYKKAISQVDAIFVRGVLIPAIPAIYKAASQKNIPVIHWLVGNPIELLKTHRRDSWLKDTLGKLFAWRWEKQLHSAGRKARAGFLCNGSEIATRHPSKHTYVTVSTTLIKDDIGRLRDDTCLEDPVKILSLCFIRPEKDIESLITAFSMLKTSRPTELILVGGRQRYPAYQARLDALVEKLNLSNRVKWMGHASHEKVFEYMQQSDVFAFPTLSEGTPRVLIEARANGIPVVSTNVGGIPDSVTDGNDGLLVPPKNPAAMALAIERIIEDGDLRRSLIANGYDRVQELTVDKFVDQVMDIFDRLESEKES